MLADLFGRPMIDWVVERLRANKQGLPVIVATSDRTDDEPLVNWCRNAGVDVFRGPLEDVLSRFLGCMSHYDLESGIRICGDSPLIAPSIVCLLYTSPSPRDNR